MKKRKPNKKHSWYVRYFLMRGDLSSSEIQRDIGAIVDACMLNALVMGGGFLNLTKAEM